MSCLRKYHCRAFTYIQSRSLKRDLANDATEVERRARALRVLDIISSKTSEASNRQNHLGEFLKTDPRRFRDQTVSEDLDLSRTKHGVLSVLEEVLLEEDSSSSVNGGMQEREEWSFDAYGLSSAVRSCGSKREFKTGSGALGQGRSVHCQTLQMGFKSYLHITNALISMYCKCGDLNDAFRIFDHFENKDVVSWNSMIAGYAQHGLATQAIEMFEVMMTKSGIKPDAITYLGVLSSCRHAGLVKEGRKLFNSMAENGMKPQLNHYSCLVDLLGRFGLLQEALDLIENMPMEPNPVIWGSLLFSCRVHGDVWMGIRAAEERLLLEPECAATHVQLANLYASVQYYKEAAMVRKVMKDKGLRTNPGCSWIEIDNDVFMFKAEDGSNCRMVEIVHVLRCLVDHMEFF
ncbi:hypothetical protein HID58_016160 [Brassica napus]|uniref:Pentatricopeptide repeat-containing protein n=1 Tax=Brassica napus TaxID=3708 RepID=A0ABQ8DM89_BRANA|nr:hypothetical protein HID58_016160 [Brassica napus]